MAGRRCSCKKVSVMRRWRNSSSEYSLFLGNSIKEAPVLGDVGEMRRLDIYFPSSIQDFIDFFSVPKSQCEC